LLDYRYVTLPRPSQTRRVVKRTADGSIVEFCSAVDAVRCAIEVQNAMVERNAGVPENREIDFRIGIHVGNLVEESDGDLMGDGVNIAARLEARRPPLQRLALWRSEAIKKGPFCLRRSFGAFGETVFFVVALLCGRIFGSGAGCFMVVVSSYPRGARMRSG
jgi:hypothetical protein